MQALYVIIIVTIVQQFESNIISPRIMSSKLNIHPLTIIILILGVGNCGNYWNDLGGASVRSNENSCIELSETV